MVMTTSRKQSVSEKSMQISLSQSIQGRTSDDHSVFSASSNDSIDHYLQELERITQEERADKTARF